MTPRRERTVCNNLIRLRMVATGPLREASWRENKVHICSKDTGAVGDDRVFGKKNEGERKEFL